MLRLARQCGINVSESRIETGRGKNVLLEAEKIVSEMHDQIGH
jgi:hypothetical protein